jgi:hypothetical protein
MTQKVRILLLSSSPWNAGRILVDEEAREVFEKIHEGPYRDHFKLFNHVAVRPTDLQRLLLKYRPHIVHFSGHGNKRERIILSGKNGQGKTIDQRGLADVLALYNSHVRLVLLNACFTKAQARFISEVVNYSIGTSRAIGDKVGVAFAGAFYRALGFGKSVKDAFESARAELGLTKMPRSRGIELFVRSGVRKDDSFPRAAKHRVTRCRASDTSLVLKAETRFECQFTVLSTTQQAL